MIRKRNFGTVVALGGFTAAIALLTGLPSSARADELSDLQANQQLLQQRIDQLAQSSQQVGPSPSGYVPGYTTPPPAGTPADAGSFPRSFLIPGTNTSLRVGGAVEVDALNYFTGNQAATGGSGESQGTINNPGSTSNLIGIPLEGSAQHSRSDGFYITARESKFNVETRTPTAYGEARTFIEMDFEQGNSNLDVTSASQVSSSYTPRLRYAYATLGGLLGGQANSNFEDSDSGAELLDFGGSTGYDGPSRQGQLRYTWQLPYGSSFSAALEMPATDIVTPFGYAETDTQLASISPCGAGVVNAGVTPVSTGYVDPLCATASQANNPSYDKMPDYTFAFQLPQTWGHFNVHALLRDLSIDDGKFVDKSYLGYALGIGGDVHTWGKDDITFNATAGVGAGRYIADGAGGLATNYTVMPTTAAEAASIIATPITEFGGHVGYQHWWLDNLRSTIDYSMVHSDVSSILIAAQTITGATPGSADSLAAGDNGTANKELDLAHLNLIWSPVAFVDLGVEYVWGHRVVVSNLKGDENSLEGTFRVKF